MSTQALSFKLLGYGGQPPTMVKQPTPVQTPEGIKYTIFPDGAIKDDQGEIVGWKDGDIYIYKPSTRYDGWNIQFQPGDTLVRPIPDNPKAIDEKIKASMATVSTPDQLESFIRNLVLGLQEFFKQGRQLTNPMLDAIKLQAAARAGITVGEQLPGQVEGFQRLFDDYKPPV